MEFPDDLRYTREHEWVRVEDDRLRVGITDFAYVDVPEVGTEIRAGEPFGEVESTKSVSDVYAPITGTVIERNEGLGDSPELVNEDPYGDGWMIVLQASDPDEVNGLLDADAYRTYTESSPEE
jgi:glycine cleavage system H protein